MNTLNASLLIDAKRDVQTPFRLLVNKPGVGQVEISFLSILRLLPAKRIVALAKIDGQKVLVKMFLGRTARKHARRERAGVSAIAQTGVCTPELLWEGETKNSRLLVFHYLADAISLAEQWRKFKGCQERIKTLTMLMKVMSILHDHGVVQNDIHLENFLFSEGRINVIDGGATERKSEEPLSECTSLSNLALFFAQFYPRFDNLIGEAFGQYQKYRGWHVSETRLQRLRGEVDRSREVRKRDYIGKTFRDCTRFLCRDTFTRFEVCERSAYSQELAEIIREPDKFIESGTILKNDQLSTVARVNLVDRSLIVKRYNIKNIWHGLRRAFRKSCAWHSWANAHRMEFLGIPAHRPIAMIESRLGPIRSTTYLITEFIEGPDALNCLTETKNPKNELDSLANILKKLSEAQISHGDLKATNFVMTEQGPVMIDLDGMKEHRNRRSFEQAFSRDLHRFMENWRDYPELSHKFSGLLRDLSVQYNVML